MTQFPAILCSVMNHPTVMWTRFLRKPNGAAGPPAVQFGLRPPSTEPADLLPMREAHVQQLDAWHPSQLGVRDEPGPAMGACDRSGRELGPGGDQSGRDPGVQGLDCVFKGENWA